MRLRKYIDLYRAGFKKASHYRLQTAASLVSSILYIVMLYAVWTAIASSGTLEGGLTKVLSYIIVAQVVQRFVGTALESYFGDKIRKGTIVNQMKRPISVRAQAYLHQAGWQSFELLTRAFPILILGLAFTQLRLPGPVYLLSFSASVLMSFHLMFAVAFCTSMLTFWTKTANGIRFTRSNIIRLFSGALFPLYLLPDGVKQLFYILPFHLIIDGPINLFLMETAGGDILTLLAQQLVWTGVFLLLGELLWRKAKKKLTVQGG
ncbi:MAG: ABC transporter permease [Candidatus Nanohaloarchaea archaeon]